MDNNLLWKSCLSQLELDLPSGAFKTWLRGTRIVKRQGSVVKIGVRNAYNKNLLEKKYKQQIKAALDQITKTKNRLSFVIDTPKETKPDNSYGPLFQIPKNNGANQSIQESYTFDNFVVGSSNNLAFAVAQAVASQPGTAHNPFFLYSPVGLGKTHLIQAIANYLKIHSPHLRVVYCTGENFTNELVESIRNPQHGRNTTAFRKKFREADILMIDDIQFIAGRDSTQEEFFHTFNALYLNNKQIIMTSDRPPHDIQKLEKRLSSRFVSGMIADIQPPDIDIRLAILQKKRETQQVQIPNEVLNLISQRVTTNIRELEGVYNQVIATAQALGRVPDTKIAELALNRSDYQKEETNTAITPPKVIKAVSEQYQVSLKDLKGKRRTKDIALARQVAMYLLRTKAGCTYEEIGDILGGRDHSTIIHGFSKVENEQKQNSILQKNIRQIEKMLEIASTQP